MDGDRQDCLAAVDDYLSKPVVITSLASTLRRYTEDARKGKRVESGDHARPRRRSSSVARASTAGGSSAVSTTP